MNYEFVCTNEKELHAHFLRTGEYCSTEKIGKSTLQEGTHAEQLNLLRQAGETVRRQTFEKKKEDSGVSEQGLKPFLTQMMMGHNRLGFVV
jgi:hypothetical protein